MSLRTDCCSRVIRAVELIVTQATAGTGRGGFSRSHRKDLGYAKSHGRVCLQLQCFYYLLYTTHNMDIT